MSDVQITSRSQRPYDATITRGTVAADTEDEAFRKLSEACNGTLHRRQEKEQWHQPYLTKLERIDAERFEFEYREEWTG